MEIWAAVLSSSVISGLIGALVAGWFSMRSKRLDYENAYFKIVLDKRIASYEEVEKLITRASIACVDENNRVYHAMFLPQKDGIQEFFLLVSHAMSDKFWLSDELFSTLRELNLIAYPAGDNQFTLLEIAKTRYLEISDLRVKIERLHNRDMRNLHLVPEFLKSKRWNNNSESLRPRIDKPATTRV